jgi:hypothetical protein
MSSRLAGGASAIHELRMIFVDRVVPASSNIEYACTASASARQ